MICPNCGGEMPEGSKFCGKCGEKLERRVLCPDCGAEVPQGMAFCTACGARVGAAPAPDTRSAKAVPADVPGAGAPGADEKASVYIRTGNCIFGDVSMTNNGETAAFRLFSDRISISCKFSCNAVMLGGWLGMAVSGAKKSKEPVLEIPYSEFAEVTYTKAKMDSAKRATILLKTGDTVRLYVAPLNKLMSGCDHISTEELYRRLRTLAQPYMQ